MAAVAITLLLAPRAGATNYSTVQSGPWDDVNTWSPSGIPTTGDSASIGNGHTVIVGDSRTITTLTVNNGGVVEVDDGGTLTLTGTNPDVFVNSQDGMVILGGGAFVAAATSGVPDVEGTGSVSVLANGRFELAIADTTLSLPLLLYGALRISANDIDTSSTIDAIAGSAIEIGPNGGSGTVTFTNDDVLSGSVTIKRNPVNASGVAVFENQGLVEALDGTFTLDSTLSSVVDTAGAMWKVADADATLRFKKSASLAGDFWVGPGTLLMNNTAVATSGLFRFNTGGTVDLLYDAGEPDWFFNVTGTGGVGSGNHYVNGSNCTSASFPYSTTVTCP